VHPHKVSLEDMIKEQARAKQKKEINAGYQRHIFVGSVRRVLLLHLVNTTDFARSSVRMSLKGNWWTRFRPMAPSLL
jgi:hypothetical protein